MTFVERMNIEEIEAKNLDPQRFIEEKTAEMASLAGHGLAVHTLSGGVHSSAVTILGHRTMGDVRL